MSDSPKIICPQCKRTSYNPGDIANKYCGYCRQFHKDMALMDDWYSVGMSEKQLKVKFRSVPWREPLPIKVVGSSGLGCRLCIARKGIKAAEVQRLPQTQQEFDKHMEEVHGKEEA